MKLLLVDRYIRDTAIPRLDQMDETTGSGSGSGTDHTHPNKSFLDNLNIDSSYRLTYENQVLSVPILEENW